MRLRLHSCALTLAVQERFRTQILQRDDSKLHHGEKTADVIPLRVGLCRRLFDLEKKPDDLGTAFQTLEKGRAQVFLENLGQANASRLAGLPQELRDKEEHLRRTIRLIDAELRTVETLPGNEAATRRLKLNEQRHRAEEEFLTFERQLKETSKAYADLRYPQPCSVEEARLCLAENEVALLFAVGEDASYVIVVHQRPKADDLARGTGHHQIAGTRGTRAQGRVHHSSQVNAWNCPTAPVNSVLPTLSRPALRPWPNTFAGRISSSSPMVHCAMSCPSNCSLKVPTPGTLAVI